MGNEDGPLDVIERQRKRGIFQLKYLEEAINQLRDKAESELTPENLEETKKAVKILKGTSVERYCNRLTDVVDNRYSRQPPIPKSNYSITDASLENLVDSYPLLSDLHVHLLGTGNTEFWHGELSRSHQTVILDKVRKKAKLGSVCRIKNRTLLFDDLVKIGDKLSEVFELNEPIPGRFDKNFSPRFVLRKFIIHKDPEVFSRLIQWNAERYVNSGVHYAELSIGAGWFIDPYLTPIIDGIESAEKDHSVLFRLLIAFNRKDINKRIHNSGFLRKLAGLKDKKLAYTGYHTDKKEECANYIKHLEQLREVRQSIESNPVLKRYIVGLDIVGNEENKPYTPFLLSEFLDFAKYMREKNPNFGFRLHLGEGISSDNDIGYVCLRLGEYYISSLSKEQGFKVRSGHGIGLLGLDDEAYNRWKKRYPTMRKAASERLLKNLQIATVEINLTSNYYLLKDPGFSSIDHSLRSHVMSPLLQKGFKIVLGTDDPGIFPDVTMRGEFRKAFDNGLIKDINTFIDIVMESVRASFGDQDTIDQLSNIISKRYPYVVVPRDKHPIPTSQPLRAPNRNRQAEFERAKRAYERGNPWLIEDFYSEYDPP
jgi:hypothetical protein